MVGLDAAGKTTILYKLKLGEWSMMTTMLDVVCDVDATKITILSSL